MHQNIVKDKLITVNGMAFLQPILDLTASLLRIQPQKLAVGRTSRSENDYAVSVVLLLVVAFESFVGRVSYLQSHLPDGIPRKRNICIPDYIAALSKSYRLKNSLTEVFILRDAIAHGHIWELEVSDHQTNHKVLGSKLLPDYGDKKHTLVINPKTRKSSTLTLNLVPRAVGIRDVRKVFDVVYRTLKFLAKKGLIEPQAFTYHARLNGEVLEFWNIQQLLKNAAQKNN